MSPSSSGERLRALAALAAFVTLAIPAVAEAASFGPPVAYSTGGIRPNSIAVADVNGDGDSDLVVANSSSNTVGVLLGNGAGGFGAPTTYAVGSGPLSVAVGDLNGDPRPDVVVANWASDDISVLIGGASGPAPAVSYTVGDQPHAVAIDDVDGDGSNDVVAANRVSDTLTVLYGDGAGSLGDASHFPAGDGPYAVTLGDLDEDGDVDAAVALFEGDRMSVLRGDGSGFSAPETYASGNGPQGIALGDLKEDGHLDIAVANFFHDLATTFIGDGTGTFTGQPGVGAGDGPKSIAVGDLDGDGYADLAVAASESDTVSVLAGDGDGGFSPFQSFAAGDQPASIVIAQLDGSDLPDIVVADRFGETVSVLLNTGSPPPPPPDPTDTTAPTITVPSNRVVNATKPSGAVVGYTAGATDDLDPAPALSCSPASGSTLPIGTTTVECTARDASGNVSTADFNVRVKGAPEQIVDLIDKVRALKGLAPVAASLRRDLETAAACVIQNQRRKACTYASFFVAGVRYAVWRGWVTSAQGMDLIADARRIKAVIGCP